MTFGEKIRNAREDMDLSQREIAKLIPMNQSNYSKIERDIQEPNLEQLRRICQILRLDPGFLLELGSFDTLTDADLRLLTDIKAFTSKTGRAPLAPPFLIAKTQGGAAKTAPPRQKRKATPGRGSLDGFLYCVPGNRVVALYGTGGSLTQFRSVV